MANTKKKAKKVVLSEKKPVKLTGLTVRSALKGGIHPGCQPCHPPQA